MTTYVIPAHPSRTEWDTPGSLDVTGQSPVEPPTLNSSMFTVAYPNDLTPAQLSALVTLYSVPSSGDAQVLSQLELADKALADYLAMADGATAAQVRDQVKLLTRVVRGLVKLAIRETRR